MFDSLRKQRYNVTDCFVKSNDIGDIDCCKQEKPTNKDDIQNNQSKVQLAYNPKPLAFKLMLFMGACH